MPDPTLSSDSYRRFLSGRASREEGRAVVRDLVRRAAQAPHHSARPGRPGAPPADYEVLVEEVAGNLSGSREAVEQEARRVFRWIEEVRGRGPEESDLPLPSLLAVEMIAEESIRTAAIDPPRAARWARVASRLAGQLEAPRDRFDALGWARLAEGTALARASQLTEARGLFAAAARAREEGSGDPMLAARLEAEAATLAFSSARFEEAVLRARRAIRIYQAVGERHRAAFCRVRLGIFLRSRSDDARPAIRELEGALAELDRTRDPRAYLGGRQALALARLQVGDLDGAQAELPELRALAAAHGSANDRAQVDWLEARVAARQGEWAKAEALLRGVRQALADLGSGTDVGLVSLELVEALAARGERQEAARLAEEALVLLGGQQVERDTLVALGLLLESIRERQVASETVRALVERVRGQLRGPRRR